MSRKEPDPPQTPQTPEEVDRLLERSAAQWRAIKAAARRYPPLYQPEPPAPEPAPDPPPPPELGESVAAVVGAFCRKYGVVAARGFVAGKPPVFFRPTREALRRWKPGDAESRREVLGPADAANADFEEFWEARKASLALQPEQSGDGP